MKPQVKMIDVSSANHVGDDAINWRAVGDAGYQAVMIKCSEGITYTNPWRTTDAKLAWVAGLHVGYYHYAHPELNGPALEARYALQSIVGLPRDLGLALDLEVAKGTTWAELSAWAQAFHEDVRREVDHSPLYVNDNFLANLPGAPWGERLWLAQTARPRQHVWAWQETTPEAVPGIAVRTDVGWLNPDA